MLAAGVATYTVYGCGGIATPTTPNHNDTQAYQPHPARPPQHHTCSRGEGGEGASYRAQVGSALQGQCTLTQRQCVQEGGRLNQPTQSTSRRQKQDTVIIIINSNPQPQGTQQHPTAAPPAAAAHLTVIQIVSHKLDSAVAAAASSPSDVKSACVNTPLSLQLLLLGVGLKLLWATQATLNTPHPPQVSAVPNCSPPLPRPHKPPTQEEASPGHRELLLLLLLLLDPSLASTCCCWC